MVKSSVLSFLIVCALIPHDSLAINQEGLWLQDAKKSLSDPEGYLSGWENGDSNPCKWAGVTCNGHASVVAINLTGASLSGTFPISLCRLPSLSELYLSYNYINSSIPNDISSCTNLTYLDLSYNQLSGQLPPSLSNLRYLRYLYLTRNVISGGIPSSFGNFQQLEELVLAGNQLSGNIPPDLGCISSLKMLGLAYNPFSPGQLPPELGNLTNLEQLWVSDCHLIGPIPASIGRLIGLQNLDVSNNGLTGWIPREIFHLKSLVQLELYNNSFTGTLSGGWSNLTDLRRFDASMNKLTGIIPDELCQLPLESLNLYDNLLEGFIPESIAKSPNLYELKLFNNQLLSGPLPSELGENSALQTLDVSYCNISGEIPQFLCQNGALENMIFINNSLSGTIPFDIAKCQTLQRVRMQGNKLSGEVPAELWGLPHVYLLDLEGNAFSGSISHLISGGKKLSGIRISKNKFSGSIPSEIGSLSSLNEFSAEDNNLSGEIPSTIVSLSELGILDLSNNNLTGGIPAGIDSMRRLNELNLASNRLSGEVPDEIGSLPVLNYLDLSQNAFSGIIPPSLQYLKLNKLNMSSNQLSGRIPNLFADGNYKDSFLGNPGLCLGEYDRCHTNARKETQLFYWSVWCFLVISGIIFLAGLACFLVNHKKIKEISKGIILTKWTSFHKLRFSELEILDGLKESNVIGTGASGKVYKVVLSSGETVAVKKLHQRTNKGKYNLNNADSADEFDMEVETLGKIRHKNIVRLLCCCDTGTCKVLVYEYMANGSLGDLLHKDKSTRLNWSQRFKIACDAAEGLSYLHHDSVPPVLHRDVKASNILLDQNFDAKISDFGVAKVVNKKETEPMSGIAGSYGYIAPEYAYTLRVNEKSDIYSFGVVMLELVTGKPATDLELEEQNLAIWVRKALDEGGVNHLIDPDLDSRFKEEICKFLDIGLLCTNSTAANRPSMRRVVNMLQELSATMPKVEEKDGRRFPSF